jgi:hypothetical protein
MVKGKAMGVEGSGSMLHAFLTLSLYCGKDILVPMRRMTGWNPDSG